MNKALDVRMKSYESTERLPLGIPVICRLDGRCFHSYTRDLVKPWDKHLCELMDDTAISLCREISGAKVAYIQSDEISIFIHNYETIHSEAWFGNVIQKMTSVSAAIASSYFSLNSWRVVEKYEEDDYGPILNDFFPSEFRAAQFDSRVFVLPEKELNNYFYWRQLDSIRNSILSLGQEHFSHKDMQGKSLNQVINMLRDIDVEHMDLSTYMIRGRAVQKKGKEWVVDREIPNFSQDKDYIERLLITR